MAEECAKRRAKNTSMGRDASSAMDAPMASVNSPNTTNILRFSASDQRAPSVSPTEAPTATATVLKSVPPSCCEVTFGVPRTGPGLGTVVNIAALKFTLETRPWFQSPSGLALHRSGHPNAHFHARGHHRFGACGSQTELKEVINADIILGNTYHLHLRPGTEVLEEVGGLHKFMNWDRPILTDSGGYQVFSLAEIGRSPRRNLQSHIDGSKHLFSPEQMMDIQRSIGADIVMAFDEYPPYPSTHAYAKNSMELTHRWLHRCVKRMKETEPLYGHEQALFPIVKARPIPTCVGPRPCGLESSLGYAIGGLSVGEPHEDMSMCEEVCAILLTSLHDGRRHACQHPQRRHLAWGRHVRLRDAREMPTQERFTRGTASW